MFKYSYSSKIYKTISYFKYEKPYHIKGSWKDYVFKEYQ